MMKEKKTINLPALISVVLLIMVAFFVGRYTQKDQGQTAQNNQQPTQIAPGEEETTILTDEDWQIIIADGAAVKGNADAKVTIVEFSEYQCPFCKRYIDESYSLIMEDYGDQIRYVFRDFPLPFHPNAQPTALAARCAGDQGKYWEMHDLLFEKQAVWSEKEDITADLTSYANQIGLNQSAFSSCLSSEKFAQAIEDDISLGQKVGVSGTPSFFINGQMLVGALPYDNFKAIIDEQLKK